MSAGLIAGACLAPQLSLYYATLGRSWLVMGTLTMLALTKWRSTYPLGRLTSMTRSPSSGTR